MGSFQSIDQSPGLNCFWKLEYSHIVRIVNVRCIGASILHEQHHEQEKTRLSITFGMKLNILDQINRLIEILCKGDFDSSLVEALLIRTWKLQTELSYFLIKSRSSWFYWLNDSVFKIKSREQRLTFIGFLTQLANNTNHYEQCLQIEVKIVFQFICMICVQFESDQWEIFDARPSSRAKGMQGVTLDTRDLKYGQKE